MKSHERLLERHRGGARGPEAPTSTAVRRPLTFGRCRPSRGSTSDLFFGAPVLTGARRSRPRCGPGPPGPRGRPSRSGLNESDLRRAEEGRRAEAPERPAPSGVALVRVAAEPLPSIRLSGALGRASPPPRHAASPPGPSRPARGAVLDRRVGGDAARARGTCGNHRVSGALSHFSAMTRPSWLGRAARDSRHRAGVASMARRSTRRFRTNAQNFDFPQWGT